MIILILALALFADTLVYTIGFYIASRIILPEVGLTPVPFWTMFWGMFFIQACLGVVAYYTAYFKEQV